MKNASLALGITPNKDVSLANVIATAVNLVIVKAPLVNANVELVSVVINAIRVLKDIMDFQNVVFALVIDPEPIPRHAMVMVACVIIKDNAIAR